jgi:hypothetical protein
MTKSILELYLYMCSTEPIIEWLEEEGVKTKEEARQKLKPLVVGNVIDVGMHHGQGGSEGSLAGTSKAVKIVLEHFKN